MTTTSHRPISPPALIAAAEGSAGQGQSVTFRLSAPLAARVDRVADQLQASRSGLLRGLVAHALEEVEAATSAANL